MSLDEGGDVRVVSTGEQITLPMTWDGTILRLGGAVADGDHIEYLSLPRPALCAFGEAHLSFGTQVRCQFLLEHPSRLDE
ncbi:hypothetical protein MesoLj113a_43770 [Mesorhizobium sp. 113-1-2]|nr:Uncharacterized protein MLTONO_2625 [Mesorhizobium loti]BAV50924.1 Uncharacterized protein MLTONO_6022 [Mesorhizobium loti]BCG70638.1 hypothetical protein MesoLj113a_17960 [Mesorhizobium sp. 113-1-2]BCG73219.1 hypothetical protein MesoLj113a_43770 [Mesorhizobium sp. 113-1-2]BCH18879.1 hypothetical protein MesoLjLa_57300 [Mesorhizobium sp. L-2-11]